MRDLKSEELDHVYGAGGRGRRTRAQRRSGSNSGRRSNGSNSGRRRNRGSNSGRRGGNT